ncbi:MAG: hypothetical protein HZB14_10330 [Actinobacteria bacterium]|nr:hypothetical protein [Actinomycetota bacterium]
MAQTKKKRKTKHRGTQAGTVESRGRTSRPRSASQARQQSLQRKQNQRLARAVQPPSWRGAAIRAGFAAGIFMVVLIVMKQPIVSSVLIGLVMFGMYIPMGFYMDKFLYDRRMKREARQREQG